MIILYLYKKALYNLIMVPYNEKQQNTGFHQKCLVTDENIVQNMIAIRLFIPRCGITVSTRETIEFRNNLLGLGVTKMSAGSITEVGGHSEKAKSKGQFEISDPRDVTEMSEMLYAKGYQPIYKDWDVI